MARNAHLPIYQSAFSYTLEVYRLRSGLPKSVKHDLGQEVSSSAIKILKCVVAANGAVQKERLLARLNLEIEVQWVLLRLLFELKGVSSGQFKVLSERLADITRQSQAWFKWVQGEQKKRTASANVSGQSLKNPVAKKSGTTPQLSP